MGQRRIVVAVADGYLDRMGEVVARLREAGVEVEEEMEAAGIVTGSVDESASLDRLLDIDGVGAAEEEETYRIPPPESDVQ